MADKPTYEKLEQRVKELEKEITERNRIEKEIFQTGSQTYFEEASC